MKKWMILSVLVFFAVGTACTPKIEQEAGALSTPIRAKDFLLKTHTQKEVKLSDFRGEKVLIHFWATWCAPCIDEIPVILNFAKKSDVRLIAISLDASWEDAHKVLPQSLVTGKVVSLIDPEMKVSEAYGSFQFPETYLINSDGAIVTKWIGPQTWSDPSFAKLVKN